MAYKTKYGQTIFDVMIQQKGSLKGLNEFIGDLDSLNSPFFLGEELNIAKEANTITDFFEDNNISTASVEIETLLSPINFQAIAMTDCDIDLSWNDSNSGEGLGYELQRSTDPNTGFVTVYSGGEETFSDGNLSADTYYYRVRALGASPSPYTSNEQADLPSVVSQITLAADFQTNCDVELLWSYSTFDSPTTIERSVNGGAYSVITTGQTGGYIDANVPTGILEYRIKKDDWNCYSQVVKINPNPLQLFKDNLHAWYKTEDGTKSSDRIIYLPDGSGNNRDLKQDVLADAPKFNQETLDGHQGLTFNPSGNKAYMDLNTENWAGLGTDSFFVVGIERTTYNNNLKVLWSNKAAAGGAFTDYKPLVYAGFTGRDYPMTWDTGRAMGWNSFDGSSPQVTVFMLDSGALTGWWNGVAQALDIDNAGVNTKSFDSFRLGNDGNLNGVGQFGIFEIMFIKGKPQDYPEAFNALHSGYLAERYPSLNIQNPNLP